MTGLYSGGSENSPNVCRYTGWCTKGKRIKKNVSTSLHYHSWFLI